MRGIDHELILANLLGIELKRIRTSGGYGRLLL
jgi:hypothetical protein